MAYLLVLSSAPLANEGDIGYAGVMLIYGTAWKKDETAALVTRALAAGFRAIDTANQAKHYNEIQVGEALQEASKKGIDRASLFLQTKFTSVDGQDHRLPYDPNAPLAKQVAQSFESSLQHLHTDYLDSYLLHGPYSYPGLGDEDWEVWGAVESEYQAGRTKQIGISNVNNLQLEELIKNAAVKPMIVQNRCFANRGWDLEVRRLCRQHGITYQGFSLLTANPFALADSRLLAIAERLQATAAQVIFSFCLKVGIVPLTGTRNETHMREDLMASKFPLTEEEALLIERIGI